MTSQFPQSGVPIQSEER